MFRESDLPSFQFAIWKIKSGNQCVFVVSIYRPPYRTTNQITDFAEWIPYITIQYKFTIVLGDFNIHVNDSMDVNANILQDAMAANGLFQWVNFPTHWLGNTLDLVLPNVAATKPSLAVFRSHCGQTLCTGNVFQHTESPT